MFTPLHPKKLAQKSAKIIEQNEPFKKKFIFERGVTGFSKRFLSSFILGLFSIFSLFFLPKATFVLLITVFCGFAAYEFFSLVEKKGIRAIKSLGVLGAAIIPFSIFKGFELLQGWELLFAFAIIFILFLIQFTRRENNNLTIAAAITFFGVFYAGWLLSFLVRIFMLPDGSMLVGFLLLTTKSGDVFAYICGNKFGKHPLIQRISPKKTVEGAVCAFLATVLFSCLSKIYLPQFSIAHLFLLGVLFGILGQVGDLSESLIKRDCNVKDSGALIPGFGGVLDLVDSLLFTAPVFYFYLIFIYLR